MRILLKDKCNVGPANPDRRKCVGYRVDTFYLERLDHILMATHLAFKAVCAEQRTS